MRLTAVQTYPPGTVFFARVQHFIGNAHRILSICTLESDHAITVQQHVLATNVRLG